MSGFSATARSCGIPVLPMSRRSRRWCKGIAFRVPAADVASALHYLWDREMSNRTYHLRELAVDIGGRPAKARAFVVDRDHANYAGRLSLDETARLILQGTGGRGSCQQYLENTV